jgi:hypothetical protein
MKKSRLFLGCMAVVALALASASCTMPDYQLSTDVYVSSVSNSFGSQYATVYYSFNNIGSKDLKNVQVEVTVTPSNGSVLGPTTAAYLLGPFTINTGSTVSGSYSTYIGSAGAYAWASASIVSVGWDNDGNSMWN